MPLSIKNNRRAGIFNMPRITDIVVMLPVWMKCAYKLIRENGVKLEDSDSKITSSESNTSK